MAEDHWSIRRAEQGGVSEIAQVGWQHTSAPDVAELPFLVFLSHCDFSLICAFRFFLSVTLRCAAIFLPLVITTQLAETVEKCLFLPAWLFYSGQLAQRGKNSVSTAHTTCRNAQMRKLVPGTDRINAMLKAPMTCLKFSGCITSQLYWVLVISQVRENADMIFVQNFTLLDFQANIFTP